MRLVRESVSHIAFLKCSECDRVFNSNQINTYASCERCEKAPLVAKYDSILRLRKEDIDTKERSMWRYAEMLPVTQRKNIVSLGEGWTPLLSANRLASALGLNQLVIKDESLNPTGSFKARGLSAAVSKAKELGIHNCIIPTAGNAGGALAAYCARGGLNATVVMPTHTPKAFKLECEYFGANVLLVDGLINDCARKVAELNQSGDYFDVSTMKEPYRLEGKKTMGYEIAEQSNWTLPDVILYPTGGGTGLVGMWKAFHEMKEAGWINCAFPKMIAVQSENCKPVVENYFGRSQATFQSTIANGLAVPFPFAHKMIQTIIKESSGTAIAVSEKEILEGVREIASLEGMFVAPEGGALLAALKKLIASGEIKGDQKILLLNTGSGYKYLENLF
jgi:threonine synthase